MIRHDTYMNTYYLLQIENREWPFHCQFLNYIDPSTLSILVMNMILHYQIIICKTVLLPVYKIEIFHLRFLHEIFPLQTETVSRERDNWYEEDQDLVRELETGQFGHQCENVPAM